MQQGNMKRASLDQIEEMALNGELFHNPDAPASKDLQDDLPPDFWETAVWVEPTNRKSVHLRINSDVYDFFVQQTGGKGHIAKMQAVLKAYADAHKQV
jgi:uncharacterized protein (DUF4415 family)